MQKKHTIRHDLWVKDLLSAPDWGPTLIFGLSNRTAIATLFLPKKKILAELSQAEKFEAQLVKLCKGFRFDVEKPVYIAHSNSIPSLSGKLGCGVAEQLIRTLNASHGHIQLLKDKLAAREEINKNKKKPGPFKKIPSFFAERVLVGIDLHRKSEDGMKLLRTFLEPNGKLAEWLVANSQSKDLLETLIVATGDNESINEWASKKRLSMERIVLSCELCKEVKSFKGHEAEYKLLRERVSNRAQKIKAKTRK